MKISVAARANPRDAGQARRGSRATCAAPTKHRAGVGRPSTHRRSASSGLGRPRRIVDDARARLPPASSEVGQNLAAAAVLLRAMPEPSTTEGRRIQGELKNLLEDAMVRRQGYPPGALRHDFLIHAGSLDPYRAHVGRNACSPGSPRQ